MTIANTALSFDGTNLMTLAYNVRSLGIDESLPDRRGGNILVPGINGRTYVSKDYEQRTIEIALWMHTRGTATSSTVSAANAGTNIETLTALFGGDGTHTLTRTRGTTTLTATVEVQKVRIQPLGPYHYNLGLSLVMPDPFWYATGTTTASGSVGSGTTTISAINNGTYPVERAIATFTTSAGTGITNLTLTSGSTWVKYTGVVDDGDTLIIDTGNFTATLNGSSVLGSITHNTSYTRWLSIPRGTNNVVATVDGVSNYSNLTLSYQAPYL
jgi:hypothetical protein